MIRQLIYLINIIFLPLIGQSQIIPEITARVDTTETSVKEVYTCFKGYINSKPDSLYENPFWNKNESYTLVENGMNCNRSVWTMFRGFNNSTDFYDVYHPKILSIERIEINRFLLRVIYNNCTEGYEKYNPVYITRLYAVKNKDGEFKLENTLEYDTRNWRKIRYKFITYFVSPTSHFDKQKAREGIMFCQKVAKKFNIKKIQPFIFYITNDSEEMGRLFNFEYWLSYSTGITNVPTREIFSAFGVASYPHEFVHMILSPLITNYENTNMLINEGVATWCAGPTLDETYDSALESFSNEIRDNDTLTIDDILTNKYRNKYDNNPLYLIGAVICSMVYEKKGIEDVIKILNLTLNELRRELPFIMQKESWKQVNSEIFEYIRNYNSH